MKMSNKKLLKLMKFDNDLNALYKDADMSEDKLKELRDVFENIDEGTKESL